MSEEPDVAHAAGRSVEELDRLTTDELRRLAFDRAEHQRDLEFFWDLIRHLPPSDDLASEDASTGNITGGVGQLVELVADLMGRGLGESEPLVRARFISYIRGDD
jgi:hypothetical protein